MKIALVHNHYDERHLASVVADMRTIGAPAIKAVWMECFGHYAALEGCHRTRAAKVLGLEPIIIEVDYSDDMATDELTIADICDSSYKSEVIEF
jgi:hypothetical protein